MKAYRLEALPLVETVHIHVSDRKYNESLKMKKAENKPMIMKICTNQPIMKIQS